MTLPRKLVSALVTFVAIALLYFLFWPVPIDPVAWSAPVDQGLVDPFAPNDRLARANPIDIGDNEGPEDLAAGNDGFIYASTKDGNIIRFRHDGSDLETFAEIGGRPLGIEFDAESRLYIANAYLGLQRLGPDGELELLVDEHRGRKLVYVNDVAIAADGTVYFSESSEKFGAEQFGGTYSASLLDIMEHGGHGRLFRFDPESGDLEVLMRGLNFANGVAVSQQQDFLVLSETGHYRVWRYWIAGPRSGTSEIILENLPAFPDNINNGLMGRFWIGMVAPRVAVIDNFSDRPAVRKAVQRMPAFLRPRAVPSSHVIAISGDGQVLMNLQDGGASYPSVTGALESREAIYLSTLFGNRVARLDKRELQRP